MKKAKNTYSKHSFKKNPKRRTAGVIGKSRQEHSIKVKVESLNENGDGVGFYKKMKLNIRKTLPGEEVLVKYDPSRSRKDRLQLEKILVPSPLRVEPECPHYEECGGCQLLHLDYQNQLLTKTNLVKQLQLSFPQLKSIKINPMQGMPSPSHYRVKTQMPFDLQSGRAIYGLYRKGTHQVVPVDFCLVENRDANAALKIVAEWANDFNIPIYDETTGEGLLRHVVIRKGQFTNQLMVIIVVTKRDIPAWQDLVRMLRNQLHGLKSVVLNINSTATNIILGEENLPAWGEKGIEDKLGTVRFKIYPETFFQTNVIQTVKILRTIDQKAQFTASDKILDLYCGVGSFSLYFAGKVDQVFGIDSIAQSIATADENAMLNQIYNAEFATHDLTQPFRPALPDGFQPTVIIADPPRKGLSEAAIVDMMALAPQKIVYVSCNPKTLFKDLAILFENGYRAEEIDLFDMFPHTSHVESMVILHKQS
ncbi:MAG: 23S rRNA (uracil(1939)-C(5))-methyltransferase RlmD [Calditrichia bacterium]